MSGFALKGVLLLISLQIAGEALALQIADLGGAWKLQDKRGVNKSMGARVPGGVYSDLQRNGAIGDPFYGFNDTATRWVAKTEWNYQRNFTVNSTLLSHSNVNLVFEGLDTFATILLNGVAVGTSDNMFVRYVYNVKKQLKIGTNTLTVQFKSPTAEADRLFALQAKNYTVVPVCVPDGYHGECHVNHIRKMQASFSWDWGPAFPSVGIWKPVYLEAYNSTVIRDVTVGTRLSNATSKWDINVTTYLGNTNVNGGRLQGTLVVKLFTDITEIEIVDKLNITVAAQNEVSFRSNFSVPASNVKLWWPNGYGNANLYKLKVTFVGSGATEQSVKHLRIGFRTIELVQDAIAKPEDGRDFYFKVNNVPIFAKGTNIIPVDVLPERSHNQTTIKFLMESAKDVHMNMIRVWGGGLYESDYLYEMADELGILIWQDFMFACSMYPTNGEFLKTVEDEVGHQVKRLQHHASVALWAGNNENEAALRQNWYGTAGNFTLYKDDYVKLYVDTVRRVYRRYDDRPFLTSSPTNGIESDKEGFVAMNPQSNHFGDVHYYNYLVDGWNANIYPVTRFASEYGYQGLPSVDTWLKTTNNVSYLHPESSYMAHRQHHPAGNAALKLLIAYQLNLPNKTHPNYYKAFIYYSQIIQAMSVKIETEYYRQWRSILNKNNQGLTMGALYWQLNDVWVAPSWASIDYDRRWKMLHYFAMDFFAPVLLTAHLDPSRQMNVYVASDLLTPVFNATARVRVYNWTSQQALPSARTVRFDMHPGKSQLLDSFYADEYLSSIRCGDMNNARKNCFFHLTVEDSKGKRLATDNFLFPASLAISNVPKAKVTISSIKLNQTGGEFDVEVKSDAIAIFVWLDSHGVRGKFSENGFLLVDKAKTVKFHPEGRVALSDLQKTLTVTHVKDAQYS